MCLTKDQKAECGNGKEIRSSLTQNILNEAQQSFRCKSKENCAVYRSKECLRCEHYCISYIDLYQIVCALEDLKR